MFWVYVLKCKNEKYYVGETTIGVKARFKEHINRTGYNSVWTGKYRPIEILWQKETNNRRLKFAKTLEYMDKNDIDDVRGVK